MADQETRSQSGPIGASIKSHAPTDEENKTTAAPPAVRFASVDQQIEPEKSIASNEAVASSSNEGDENENIKELSKNLHGSQLAGRRMSAFAFEPVSLPASRVPSHDESSREASRHNTFTSSGRESPHHSPRVSSMHSPPITPAATRSTDAAERQPKDEPLQKVYADVDPTADGTQLDLDVGASPSSTNLEDSRSGSPGVSTRPTSRSVEEPEKPKQGGAFSIGPSTHGSVPVSRETSPGGSTRTPPTYSRPFTPAGDVNDPYAANKRTPQPRNLDAIDQRFKFQALGSKNRSSTQNLPRSSRSKPESSEKRSSQIFGAGNHKDHLGALNDDGSSSALSNNKHGSMSELKRFLKIGGHHKHSKSRKGSDSPTPSLKPSSSAAKTPPHQKTPQLPFDDSHGLASKYGKFGKVLGAGAGGSVRLMKRSDNTVFAVKEFRSRHSYETEKEYAKKVTAEFCIGSALHHGNIIEALDIVQEKGKWYEVMEYAPYDLFAIVMTGKMSKEEVNCAFLQILSGVTFLHGMGLAHRDLKLDNVVVNEYGIMKIIDFGSAAVFKYPFENNTVLAHGIVGSDPYLAPEVYDQGKYDPQPVDIWSLAIIFCCMYLRRFPWKMPRMTDNSYKLFAASPSPGTDMRRISVEHAPSKSTTDLDTPARDSIPDSSPPSAYSPSGEFLGQVSEKKEVLKGPWRLLRLLPRETRHIMSRMLEIDPKKRAKMSEVIEDEWVSSSEPNVCSQQEGKHGVPGMVIPGKNHTHTLEGPSPPAPSVKEKTAS